jgi:hypothetical protein
MKSVFSVTKTRFARNLRTIWDPAFDRFRHLYSRPSSTLFAGHPSGTALKERDGSGSVTVGKVPGDHKRAAPKAAP